MLGLRIFVYVVVAFMALPIAIIVPISFTGSGQISFPPAGFSFQWYMALFSDRAIWSAVTTSFILAGTSTAAAIMVSLPAAIVIHRGRFWGRSLAETVATSPRMVPQIVLGLGMLILFERLGWIETFGVLLGAHLVMLIPFAFRTIYVGVATLDRRLELSSEVLGASFGRTFVKVVLPQLKTGIIAASIFGFVLSLNNVTMALFLAGADQRTLPLEVFYRMYIAGMNPMIPALATVMAALGIVMFIIVDRVVGVYQVFTYK